MNDLRQITTTCETKEQTQKIAAELIVAKVAACVQVSGPIDSTFHWQGNSERAEEWLCVVKTDEEHCQKAERLITELHTYDVPEIITTEISASEKYGAWVKGELT